LPTAAAAAADAADIREAVGGRRERSRLLEILRTAAAVATIKRAMPAAVRPVSKAVIVAGAITRRSCSNESIHDGKPSSV